MKLVVTDGATLSGGGVSLDGFRRFGELVVHDLTAPEQLAERVGDADAVLCNKTPIPAELFDQCPNLRYVGECATGYNNIDIAAAKAHGVTVCNVGGYGSIGRKVAAIGAAFGMRPVIATRTQPADCPYPLVTVDEAFRLADVLTLHVPLTEQTAGMVNARRLSAMKPTALLVNTARGGLIVETDLAQALRDGVIAGAALDVLTEEPMGDTPLADLENCTLTPHVAWTPLETRQRLLEQAVENVRCWLDGKPQNVITAP